jgi:hypothetical protein
MRSVLPWLGSSRDLPFSSGGIGHLSLSDTPRMMLPFGALEKDRAGLDTGLLTIARNCFPNTIGWGPMPSLAEAGVAALPSACLGMGFARTKTGSYQAYAGTATKLYRLVSGAWADYTRTVGGNYTTVAGNYWQFAQYDSKFVAVNGTDANQIIDIDAGATSFSAQGGSPPVARYVWTVGDFLFLADANNRRRFLCSGFNDPEFWTIGSNLCDEFIIPDGGSIAGPGRLGSYGLILQDGGAARRLISVEGDPNIAWRLEEIQGIKSAVNGYSTIAANGMFFYLAEDGPYSLSIDGSNTPIGSHRISEEFLANCDQARIEQFIGFADPYTSRVYWAYYSSPSATTFDRLLGYDFLLDRLFFVEINAQMWGPIIMPGQSLEDLTATFPSLDAMTISLDARQFQGGRPTLAAINSSGKLALLSGSNATATLRLSGTHLVPGMRALLTEVDPIGEWGDASVSLRIGKRENSGQTSTWVGPFTPSTATGIIYTRASARIHELELTIAGDGWTFAQALSTTEKPDGKR